MQILKDTFALGFEPGYLAPEALRTHPVEVRIGIGPLIDRRLSARVLAYAAFILKVFPDIEKITKVPFALHLFSSAPKTLLGDPELAAFSTEALRLAFLMLGFKGIISTSLANERPEVPAWDLDYSPDLGAWLAERDAKYDAVSRRDLNYTREHAAASMFGDLEERRIFRITVGGANEGRYWAARLKVRERARNEGLAVVPALAVIFPALRVPWYSAIPSEPEIWDDNLEDRLDDAANPSKGGTTLLSREAKILRTVLKTFPLEEYRSLISGGRK